MRHLVLVGALFLAAAPLVLAQTATGVIRGTVQDSFELIAASGEGGIEIEKPDKK